MSITNPGGAAEAGQETDGGTATKENVDAGKGDAAKADGATGDGEGADAATAAAAAKEPVHEGEFDVEAIGDDLKNPGVYNKGLFFGKYKTLGDAAKGLKELNGKVREPEKAPDKYDFSKMKIEGHDGLTVDENDPVAKTMLPVMKELGISQATAEKLAAAYLPTILAAQPDEKREFESLGKDGQAMVENFNELIQDAPDDVRKAADAIPFTANVMKLLHHFAKGQIRTSIPAKIPGAEGKNAAQLKADAFAYKDKHAATIDSDQAQQAEYNRLMEEWGQADEREQRVKK